MAKKITLILMLIGAIILLFLPIVPVQVVPEVTLKVIDTEGNPMPNLEIIQYWQHWTFESQSHIDEVRADRKGYVTFSEKKIRISLLSLFVSKVLENTIGLIAVHSGSGPHSGFRSKLFKSENRWCYPCNKNTKRINEIVILEKNQ